jgi:alkanesulfonate monooxygenase SsuD/methylene tetrahydromethanopterin reductase-like flavin-dependent oxidoreductase (luciferase family)
MTNDPTPNDVSSLDLGVFLPSMTTADAVPGDMAAAARHAEGLGYESVWAVDQLVAGTGVPFLESTVVLATAAAATERVRIGYGVLILPLRPVAWIAKEVASLQLASGGRLLLGVGVGGDRHDRSWAAVGVPVGERGRRTDAALRVLPDLVAGKPARLDDPVGDGTVVQLSPGAPMPPVLVGGGSDAALRRVVEHGDGWFGLPDRPEGVAAAAERLAAAATAAGRARPPLTTGIMLALAGDPAVPDHAGLVRRLSDPDGMFGMPAEAVDDVLFVGTPAALAARLAELRAAGASRVVASIAAGDWFTQVELLAEAAALVPSHPVG